MDIDSAGVVDEEGRKEWLIIKVTSLIIYNFQTSIYK